MEILHPKQYLDILYKIFSRGISFEEETKGWINKKGVSVLLQAQTYNFVLGLTLIAVLHVVSLNGHFEFDFFLALTVLTLGILGGITGGVARIITKEVHFQITGGVSEGIIFGIPFGIGVGILGGVTGGFFSIIAQSIIFGIVVGIVLGIVLGVVVGIWKGFTKTIPPAIVVGIIGGANGAIGVGVLEEFDIGLIGILYFYIILFILFILITCYNWLFPPKEHPLIQKENIKFPIPFFSEILRSYRKKRGIDYAVKVILFTIENHPKQHKKAKKALLLITFDVMSEFANINQIINLEAEISYLPSRNTLPEYFNSLDFFNVISEDLKKASESNDTINILNSYKQVKEALEEKKKENLLQNEKYDTEISKVTNKWLTIISQEI